MSDVREFSPVDDPDFTAIHYRRPPWIEDHPTLCGRDPKPVAYTSNHLKVTCKACLDALSREVTR